MQYGGTFCPHITYEKNRKQVITVCLQVASKIELPSNGGLHRK